MDIKRTVLLIALAVVSYLLLLAWNEDYPPLQNENAINNSATLVTSNIGSTANAHVTDLPEILNASNERLVVTSMEPSNTEIITVYTPTQIVKINTRGGDIVELDLPKFPAHIENSNAPFSLLNTQNLYYVAQSGLIGTNGPDASTDGRPKYSSEKPEYFIDSGTLNVDLHFTTVENVDIIKRFSFSANDYLIGISYLINNLGTTTFRANMYGQIKRDGSSDPSTISGMGSMSFLGGVTNLEDDPYAKYELEDIEDGIDNFDRAGGWIGFSQHYFLSAFVPEATKQFNYSMRQASDDKYLFSLVESSPIVAGPGEKVSTALSYWAGPKDQYRLEEISPDLGLTIDYGKLWFAAYPLFWLVTRIQELVGNFGVSIILLTILVRLVLYPLSIKQFSSAAKMRKLQPKIQQLRDRYGDDQQKMMQEQMALWKREKVNPMSGCLPPLLQMPFFIGMYWMLRESVEVRHAPFALWYTDLSVPDPYFVLPLLLGAIFYIQQNLTPMMIQDPTQAKVMKFMPVMFTVFFLWFPSGLVLYSLTNAFIGVVQQYAYNKLFAEKLIHSNED